MDTIGSQQVGPRNSSASQSNTHHRGLILTRFASSSPLIARSYCWDGRVGFSGFLEIRSDGPTDLANYFRGSFSRVVEEGKPQTHMHIHGAMPSGSVPPGFRGPAVSNTLQYLVASPPCHLIAPSTVRVIVAQGRKDVLNSNLPIWVKQRTFSVGMFLWY